jgi:hypothetical protein
MRRTFVGAMAFAFVSLTLVLTGVASGSTVVTTPNGTWTAYPGQSFSEADEGTRTLDLLHGKPCRRK